MHPAAHEAARLGSRTGLTLPAFLAGQAQARHRDPSATVRLAHGLHVVPEFQGNRAPFADPHARAMISGLGMDRDLSSLTAHYVAGLCGKGHGLRQISGCAGQSDLVRQILAACAAKAVGNLAEGRSRVSQASRACVAAPGDVR